jgi:hypothetical protein
MLRFWMTRRSLIMRKSRLRAPEEERVKVETY